MRHKRELVRLVRRSTGMVTTDPTGAMRGRGAYVCENLQCAERALKAGRLTQAFRKQSEAGESLAEEVRGRWQR